MKSWIEVSAARLAANFHTVQAAAGPLFEVVAVIKADGYGHGAELCAQTLAAAGARWFGVTDLEEGERVRHALGETGLPPEILHVLVMCGFEPGDAPGLVRAGLTPVVWTPAHIDALEAAAAEAGQRVAVHVEIDSGMARQGVRPGAELSELTRRLWDSLWVRCEGVFSHLSSSEVAQSSQTALQEQRFSASRGMGGDPLLLPEYAHLGNSSAVDEGGSLRWLQETHAPGVQLMVRPGLALYGYVLPLENAELPGALWSGLEPVATWKTRVIGLREIAAGDTVGYGATFVATELMKLALLPIGYADGFRREASSGVGNGWVVIGHRRAQVVGRVSMNLTVVDVTGHEAAGEPVAVGDEVVLLGEGVTAGDHARWCVTIPYDILCGMRGHRRLLKPVPTTLPVD